MAVTHTIRTRRSNSLQRPQGSSCDLLRPRALLPKQQGGSFATGKIAMTPKKVKQESLEKWQKAVHLIAEMADELEEDRDQKYYRWWINSGRKPCSFCIHYKNYDFYTKNICGECPLKVNKSMPCHPAWTAIHLNAEAILPEQGFVQTFEREVPRMLAAIEAVETEEE